VEPQWPSFGDFADQAGHGGGDFWELYYFAREVLENVPAPWNIYEACDVTLAGIMAVRSQEANGMPMEIPDFRDKAVREQFRNDFRGMTRSFDPQKIFPEGHDTAMTSRFNFLMVNIEKLAMDLRTALDGAAIYEQIKDPADRLVILETLKNYYGAMLDLGATTFWEDFDIRWAENTCRLDEICDGTKKDIHGDFGKYCYIGYRHSLCHGWSSGPVAFLTEYVLGIQIKGEGCSEIEITPHLGHLRHVKGSIATPYGKLTVEHMKRADGTVETKIDAPKEITVVCREK
jgi:hypothetical protein